MRREYWVLVHWTVAMVTLVSYALYQLRHWLRVRQHAQRTHNRVGLHAFFVICMTKLTGLPLVTPLERGTRLHTIVDLAHIFTGFVFVLLVSAYLTLAAVYTEALTVIDRYHAVDQDVEASRDVVRVATR